MIDSRLAAAVEAAARVAIMEEFHGADCWDRYEPMHDYWRDIVRPATEAALAAADAWDREHEPVPQPLEIEPPQFDYLEGKE